MRRGAWTKFLAGGLSAVAGAGIAGGSTRLGLVQAIGWVAIAVTASVTWSWGSDRRLPWRCFTAAGALFLLAALVRGLYGDIVGVESPFPSPGDPLFVLGYLSVAVGELLLIRTRRASVDHERDSLLDAVIVAAGVGVVLWAGLMAPYVRDGTIPIVERGLNVGYSALDLMLVVLTLRLAVGPGIRNPSYYLLAGSISLLLVTDLLSTLETIGVGTGADVLVLTPLVYVLFGTAALHPSMADLTRRTFERESRLSRGRVVLLAVALLMAPGVLVAQVNRGKAIDLPVVVCGSIVLSILVLARLSRLVRAKETTAEREAVLRRASTILVTATTREGIYDGTLVAALELAQGSPATSAALILGEDTDLRTVAARPAESHPELGELAVQVHTALAERRSIVEGGVAAVPLISQNASRGALIVMDTQPLHRSLMAGLEALAAETALALESAGLTEALHRQRSERRFRALVEHSSDIVMVVNEAGLVTFASPACEHLLGRDAASFEGSRPFALAHPDDAAAAAVLVPTGQASTELRLQHRDGSFRWFEVTVRDLSNEPEVEGAVINAREINDRKVADGRLTRSEARFRALVQNSSDVVAVVDRDGLLTYVSPSMRRVLGYRPDDLVGTSAADLIVREDARAASRMRGLLAGPPFSQTEQEVRVQARSGRFHTLGVTITDLRREPAVGGVVLNARDITERKALEQDLRRQALEDSLTGLGNRAMFSDRVTRALSGRDDLVHAVAVLFVDLDDFKVVNDSLGHAAGDALLMQVASRLRSCLREEDSAARFGGDEFAVLVDTARDEEEILAVAGRLLDSLREPFPVQGREIGMGASVGVAISADRAMSAEVLIRNADMAMYMAKSKGKGRVELFQAEMHAAVFERLEVTTQLARAVEDGQLVVHYQPVVSLDSGRIEGVEALVRWQHPQRGLLGPHAFVPLAEETGLIVLVGRAVLEEACRQLAAWRRVFPTDRVGVMHVNVSVRQLQEDAFVDDIETVLQHHELVPSDLVLELTETTLMEDMDVARQRLNRLAGLGVGIAVDDFGTGYSSLGYIKQFPVDWLKIDRSFVDGLGTTAGDEGMIRAIVDLAAGLGIKTVAEGIEGARQLELLRVLGCDHGQGYYFAKPLPPDDMEMLLAAGLEGVGGEAATSPTGAPV